MTQMPTSSSNLFNLLSNSISNPPPPSLMRSASGNRTLDFQQMPSSNSLTNSLLSNFGQCGIPDMMQQQAPVCQLSSQLNSQETNVNLLGNSFPVVSTAGGQVGTNGTSSTLRSTPKQRMLKILDHTVHRIDTFTKENGTMQREMVVSNLRHFTLKVGVVDSNQRFCSNDEEIRLQAQLLYENGMLVEQQATCQELLAGKTEVDTFQGVANFKLKITSLSSHRDKQRFRVRISAKDPLLLLREPTLTVVTTPMKCVTKLKHKTGGKREKDGMDGPVHEADEEDEPEDGPEPKKAKLMEEAPLSTSMQQQQQQQIDALQQTNQMILQQLSQLKNQLEAVTSKLGKQTQPNVGTVLQ